MANVYICSGNLVKKPDLLETDNKKVYCLFTLAVKNEHAMKNGKRDYNACFFPQFKIWGNSATSFQDRAEKGIFVIIKKAYLQTYQRDDTNGYKRTEMIVIVEEFDIPVLGAQHKTDDNMGEDYDAINNNGDFYSDGLDI